jgi:hypothetical protein
VSGRLGVEAGGFVDLEDGSPVALESASAGPVITFQIALASRPGDEPLVYTTVPGTLDISYQRGEPNEYGQMETGVSTVVVGDAASALDPGNPDSPYAPNVKRGKAMRAFITLDGTDYPLFQHFIERLPRTRSRRVWTERSITGVDAFASFALAGSRAGVYPGQASGARFGHVLDDVNWPARGGTSTPGQPRPSTRGTSTDNDRRQGAHAPARRRVTSENGFGFMDASGDARFIERHRHHHRHVGGGHVRGRALNLATGSYPGALPYVSLASPSPPTCSTTTRASAASGGATSWPRRTRRPSTTTGLAQGAPAPRRLGPGAPGRLNWKLSQTKDPDERVDAITDYARNSTFSLWVACFQPRGRCQGQGGRVGPGLRRTGERQFLIRHLAVDLPTDLTASTFTFQLTPASVDSWLVLDDTTRGTPSTRATN